MKTAMLFLCIYLGTLCIPGGAAAEIYTWADENGVMHFGDTPPSRGNAEVKSMPTQPYDEADSVPLPLAPQTNQQATRKPSSFAKKPAICEDSEVELYATSWCSYCQKAREFFNERGVAFTEYDIEEDRDAAQRKQEIDSLPGVPFAMINGQPIHGFLPSAYGKALSECPE